MKKVDQLLNEYGESHQNKTNKLIHWLCVPAIFFSIVGLVWEIPLGPLVVLKYNGYQYVNWASLTLCLVFVYYFTLSPLLTVGMILFSGGCLYITNLIENSIMAGIIGLDLWAISLIIFAIAWVFQFIGHHIEGKKPSFLKDIQFLMIGPAWLMHFIYKKLHIPY